MKGIVVTTANTAFIKDFRDPLYKTVGAAVGGYIEHVTPKYLPRPFCMIVNDECLLRGLCFNPIGSALYGTPEHGQPIVGDIVLMKDGYRDGEPDIVGLEENDIAAIETVLTKYSTKFERSCQND